jgi:hypothetical protein
MAKVIEFKIWCLSLEATYLADSLARIFWGKD